MSENLPSAPTLLGRLGKKLSIHLASAAVIGAAAFSYFPHSGNMAKGPLNSGVSPDGLTAQAMANKADGKYQPSESVEDIKARHRKAWDNGGKDAALKPQTPTEERNQKSIHASAHAENHTDGTKGQTLATATTGAAGGLLLTTIGSILMRIRRKSLMNEAGVEGAFNSLALNDGLSRFVYGKMATTETSYNQSLVKMTRDQVATMKNDFDKKKLKEGWSGDTLAAEKAKLDDSIQSANVASWGKMLPDVWFPGVQKLLRGGRDRLVYEEAPPSVAANKVFTRRETQVDNINLENGKPKILSDKTITVDETSESRDMVIVGETGKRNVDRFKPPSPVTKGHMF